MLYFRELLLTKLPSRFLGIAGCACDHVYVLIGQKKVCKLLTDIQSSLCFMALYLTRLLSLIYGNISPKV